MTHLFKESETRQCEDNERKQGNVVTDESGDIQCIFFFTNPSTEGNKQAEYK